MAKATFSGTSSQALFPLESIATLADIDDEKEDAVTFYFSRSSFPDESHHEEELSIEHLVDTARNESPSKLTDPGVSKDLARILDMEPEIRESAGRFRAVFACSNRQIWQEACLPVRGHANRLEIARQFRLVPLLRALESCRSYMPVIVEHGKARIFKARGMEIHELEDQFSSVDLSVHADDSRVGWSHHIDANVDERTAAFMKKLALDLLRLVEKASDQYLVIGCREDVRSELEPQLARAGVAPTVAGYFHLPSFEMTPNDVLLAAMPVFEGKQRQRYADCWKRIQESAAQSATGIDAVLRQLEAGHVRTLFLGDTSGKNVIQCSKCHAYWFTTSCVCGTCGSSDISIVPVEELIFRKALRTDAEVIAPNIATAVGDVGAILRY